MPRKVFVAGEILTAADVNANLMDQAVQVFDDASARDAAIPSPTEGMIAYLKDTDALVTYGTAWGPAVNTASLQDASVTTGKIAGSAITEGLIADDAVTIGKLDEGLANFTASTAITASDASWAVPTLASPIVKVTVIGGGGGGGGYNSTGGNGGITTFDAGAAGTVTATGGEGAAKYPSSNNVTAVGRDGTPGLASGNHGNSSSRRGTTYALTSDGASGGAITVAYLDLTGITTVNVTIGAGGTVTSADAGVGGRGEVIVEYVAG